MRALTLLCLLLTFYSCSKDFNTTAPYEDITVVYGLLEMGDTAHYISVRKTFLGNDKDAREMALVPDSSYYKDLHVRFIESDKNGILDEVALHLTDLNNEGYAKKEGNFFNSPNYVFKFKKQLNPELFYRLVVTNNATGRIDSSKEFRIVAADRASTNAPEFTIVNFASMNHETAFTIADKTPVNAEYMRGGFTFHYIDSNTATTEKTRKDFTIFFGNTVSKAGEVFKLRIFDIDIRAAMAQNIKAAPPGIVRLMDSCEVWYCAGGKELTKYMTIENVQKQFITSDMIKPKYTNMMSAWHHQLSNVQGTYQCLYS